MSGDTQGKGSGEGAVERNTSRASENWSSGSGTQQGSFRVDKIKSDTARSIANALKD